MTDQADLGSTDQTTTTASADGAVARPRRGGRKVTRTPTDLRSVVLGCRVDPSTADEFSALAETLGTDRAGLLASLVASALSRPAPIRHDHPPPKAEHKQLSPLVRQLQDLRGDLRKGHGTLVQLAGIARTAEDFDTLGHTNRTLSAQDRMIARVEAEIHRVNAAIERFEGGGDG